AKSTLLAESPCTTSARREAPGTCALTAVSTIQKRPPNDAGSQVAMVVGLGLAWISRPMVITTPARPMMVHVTVTVMRVGTGIDGVTMSTATMSHSDTRMAPMTAAKPPMREDAATVHGSAAAAKSGQSGRPDIVPTAAATTSRANMAGNR